MKKTYELNYGNKATLNTGNYENLSPMFNIKTIIEVNLGETHPDIPSEFAKMKKIVEEELSRSIKEVKQKLQLETLKHIRFYEIDGIKYPSVTSIISPDPLEIPNIELYQLRGNIVHSVTQHYIETGKYEWKVSQADLEKLAPINGIEGYEPKWVTEDRRFEFGKTEQQIVNKKLLYAGKYDADGLFESMPALYDIKTGSLDKKGIDKAFMQLAAYAECVLGTKKLVIIPCSPKMKKEPIVTEDISKYFSMFELKRIEFKERFGV